MQQEITLKIKGTRVQARRLGTESSAARRLGNPGLTTLLIHPNKAFLKISPEEIEEQTKALKKCLDRNWIIPQTSS